MSGFNLDEYVDVAERIKEFKTAFPDGSLQSELTLYAQPAGWLCVAHAYRNPEDTRPGVGHAFEPIPGKTPYTKDSEAMNAETSAWGRAIIALGFETKKIASRQEVEARKVSRGADGDSASGNGAGSSRTLHGSPAPPSPGPVADGVGGPGPGSPFTPPAGATSEPNASEPPDDGGDPGSVLLTFGKHKGKRLRDVPEQYLQWWAGQEEPKTADLRRQRAAVNIFLNGPQASEFSDDDLPF